MEKKKFALIGLAGYIAPRHLQAIQDVGGELIAALDPHDSVGIIDRYFPDAAFFTEFERFDRHLEKLRRKGIQVDYVTVCSPNYLHDAHSRFALRIGADAICEKPLVLEPHNVDALKEFEEETGKHIYPVLQLRVHPTIKALQEKYPVSGKKHEIDLAYITPRGNWYKWSWKGNLDKSGGVATNIGIHFFDMLILIFGDVQENIVTLSEPDRMSGYLELAHARVRWYLSIRREDVERAGGSDGKPYRSITVDGEEIEFSSGFTDLHTETYKHILAGNGFDILETKPSIQTVYDIREAEPQKDVPANKKHRLVE